MSDLRLPPSPSQLVAFAAYVRAGSQKDAASLLGLALPTIKNQLSALYDRLGVDGAMEAATKLGWVSLPGDTPAACGWIGYCSRPQCHRGHHGDFRAFSDAPAPLDRQAAVTRRSASRRDLATVVGDLGGPGHPLEAIA